MVQLSGEATRSARQPTTASPCKTPRVKSACRKSRWLPETLKALSIGLPYPRTADWYKIEDILGTALNRALIEKGNAKQHLDAAAREATVFLEGAGYPVG